MSDGQTERFDGIAAMRAIRDRMNEELADSTVEEVREWLDSYEYKSPTIRRLAEYHKSQLPSPHRSATLMAGEEPLL